MYASKPFSSHPIVTYISIIVVTIKESRPAEGAKARSATEGEVMAPASKRAHQSALGCPWRAASLLVVAANRGADASGHFAVTGTHDSSPISL